MSSYEKDIQLIQYVEPHKHLYDKKSKLHKDSVAIQNTWETIANRIKIPASECQHRWDMIRNRYTKEKRIQLQSPGSSGSLRKEWPCMKYLHFLQDVVQSRKRFGIGKTDSAIEDMQEMWENDLDGASTVKQQCLEDVFSMDASTSQGVPATECIFLRRMSESSLDPHTPAFKERAPVFETNGEHQKSRESNVETHLVTAIKLLTDFVTSNNTKKMEHDSDMMFALSLYDSLKNIKNKKNKNKAKIAILQSLGEFLDD